MKITFVGPLISTFVKNDVTILRQQHEVDAIDVNLGKGIMGAMRLATLHFRVMTSLLTRDALFCLVRRLLFFDSKSFRSFARKESIRCCRGGFDITYIPGTGDWVLNTTHPMVRSKKHFPHRSSYLSGESGYTKRSQSSRFRIMHQARIDL